MERPLIKFIMLIIVICSRQLLCNLNCQSLEANSKVNSFFSYKVPAEQAIIMVHDVTIMDVAIPTQKFAPAVKVGRKMAL